MGMSNILKLVRRAMG